METRNKVPIFWMIVWAIFLFVLLLMISFAIPRTLEAVRFEPGVKKFRAFNRTFTIEQVQEPVQSLPIAEPLYGEELYRFYIAQIHEQHYPDVDPYIALAVLETESNYNPNVKSKVGSVGLMQVIPKYHVHRVAKYGLNDIWDPYTNIICGMDFLNDLIHAYGTWDQALLGYNNSQRYVSHVLALSESLKGDDFFGQT